MQRAGALRQMGPPRPGPLLNRPVGDNCSQRGTPSHTNDGPKNQGRSLQCREDVEHYDHFSFRV
jgi:hypothetical protein